MIFIAALIWLISYFLTFAGVTTLFHSENSPLSLVATIVIATSVAVFNLWIFRPALTGKQDGRRATVMRLKRICWTSIGVIFPAMTILLWLLIPGLLSQKFNFSYWIVLAFFQAGAGISFVRLMKKTPPNANFFTVSTEGMINRYIHIRNPLRSGDIDKLEDISEDFKAFKEIRTNYENWHRQLVDAFENDRFGIVSNLLDSPNPETGLFLFWLQEDNKGIANRVTQFIEDAPFVGKVFAPVVNSILWSAESDIPKWNTLVQTFQLDQPPNEVVKKHYSYQAKYLMDRLFAALLLFGPLLPMAWLILGMLTLSARDRNYRNSFFVSQRIGIFGDIFTRYQFRTLTGVKQQQITTNRFGSWLIWSRLDQIPSLWNVVQGKMALIGPNPMYPAFAVLHLESENSQDTAKKLRYRLSVRPGLLDVAALDAILRPTIYRSYINTLDIHYSWIANWSLGKDLVLLTRGIMVYLSFLMANGAYNLVDPTDLPPQQQPVTLPYSLDRTAHPEDIFSSR